MGSVESLESHLVKCYRASGGGYKYAAHIQEGGYVEIGAPPQLLDLSLGARASSICLSSALIRRENKL
jgi:hypothetical protein